jgi:hypothetical protein
MVEGNDISAANNPNSATCKLSFVRKIKFIRKGTEVYIQWRVARVSYFTMEGFLGEYLQVKDDVLSFEAYDSLRLICREDICEDRILALTDYIISNATR